MQRNSQEYEKTRPEKTVTNSTIPLLIGGWRGSQTQGVKTREGTAVHRADEGLQTEKVVQDGEGDQW